MANINATARGQVTRASDSAAILSHLFGGFALVADLLVIIVVSVAVGTLYHLYVYAEMGPLSTFVRFGALVALLYLVIQSASKRYETLEILHERGSVRRTFRYWTWAFLCTLCVGFILKELNIFSRGSVILLYIVGLAALLAVRWSAFNLARRGLRIGWLAPRRILLVGTNQRIQEFCKNHNNSNVGVRFEGMVALPTLLSDKQTFQDVEQYRASLREIAQKSRHLEIDEILLLIPWFKKAEIQLCVDAFMCMPAAIHLGPELVFSRYKDIETSRIGRTDTLKLTRAPLSPVEVFAKRSFDIVASITGLVVLAPFLALIAVLIRLNSGGPALFIQSRYGFNQRPFRILKFRTMTSSDDGENVPQATHNDPRITRLGKFLRRWNIDELPQLVNVLVGDMSIVGPRPHAIAHNKSFEKQIARYASQAQRKARTSPVGRRSTVCAGVLKPWARCGPRLEHDLYYIDNWSFWLDFYIIAMTVLSKRAFRNAT